MELVTAVADFLGKILAQLKDHPKQLKWLSIVGVPVIIATFCFWKFIPALADHLSTQEKEKLVNAVPLFNRPGMSDDDYYLHKQLDVVLSKKDYSDFETFHLNSIHAILDSADRELVATNAWPYAASLFRLFKTDKEDEKALLFDLMDNYFINVVETLDLGTNRYSIALTVSRQAGKEMDSVLDYFRNDKPCARKALEIITSRLDAGEAVVISFDEIVQGICASCPDATPYIQLLRQRCGGGCNCNNLYFSRGAYKLNSLSINLLSSFSDLLLEALSQKRYAGLTIKLEGYADATAIAGPIPIEEGCPTALPGVFLDKQPDDRVFNITTNNQLSYARGCSVWTFLKRKFTNANVHLYYTGRGVGAIGATAEEDRTVRITIKKN